MENTLKNAIAYAKRNAFIEKYSFMEMLEDVILSYNLRYDEIEPLYKAVVKYCDKYYCYTKCDNRVSLEKIQSEYKKYN